MKNEESPVAHGDDIEQMLEELLNELDVKKILVAEREPDHLDAAERFYARLHNIGVLVRFSMTEQDAKEKIKEGFLEKDPYKMVISSYQLDEKESGLAVMREAARYGAFGALTLHERTGNPKEPYNTHVAFPGTEKETLILGKNIPSGWEAITIVTALFMNKDDHMDTLRDTGMKVGEKPVFGDGNSRNFHKFMKRTYDLPLDEKAPILDYLECLYKMEFYPDPARMVAMPREEDQVRYIGGMRNMRRKNAH